MKVIATALGFAGCLRQPGDEFEMPDDSKPASWFKLVDPPAADTKAPKAKAADTKAAKQADSTKPADSTDLA